MVLWECDYDVVVDAITSPLPYWVLREYSISTHFQSKSAGTLTKIPRPCSPSPRLRAHTIVFISLPSCDERLMENLMESVRSVVLVSRTDPRSQGPSANRRTESEYEGIWRVVLLEPLYLNDFSHDVRLIPCGIR